MKADEYGRINGCKRIAIHVNTKYPHIDVYGDADYSHASFTDEGLKELIAWLKENKPGLFV